MANKIQIKRFLERKQFEAIEKLEKESEEKQKQAKEVFFEVYKDKFIDIKNKLTTTLVQYDVLTKSIEELGLASFGNKYSNPRYYFNEIIDKVSIVNLKNHYIDIKEVANIKANYDKKINECNQEYSNLIALCGANNVKDGLEILENLGFNIDSIEVKQEPTELVTNINAKKLFM
ncbi:MAG: hypothetical protein K0S18_1700 [Anaerocolumna sp.]|jgi:NADH dehydrogenase FAD-containing subunit|nr:hypothetical protein [Anaerocolumna sp.]